MIQALGQLGAALIAQALNVVIIAGAYLGARRIMRHLERPTAPGQRLALAWAIGIALFLAIGLVIYPAIRVLKHYSGDCEEADCLPDSYDADHV